MYGWTSQMSTRNARSNPFTPEQLATFARDGFIVLPGLFSRDELKPLADYFQAEALAGRQVEGYWHPNPDSEDPLERFPRVMYPHRFHGLARSILLDPRLMKPLRDLMGAEPLAGQSMYYFKPPGARGQALHQDNRALQVKPDTCMAAWIAIDPSTEENGCLFAVPGTHTMELVCPGLADRTVSSTSHALEVPEDCDMVPLPLDPGDALFFNGSLIHGSHPNTHPTMWRRAYILHYVPKGSQSAAAHFNPLIDFDGREHSVAPTEGGGPCAGEYLPLELQK